MELIEGFANFPFTVRQPLDRDWCIPACIEAITRYHVPNSPVRQESIADKLGDNLGLEHIKKTFDGDSDFSWATIEYYRDVDFRESFGELERHIESFIVENKPPIVSVPHHIPDGTLDGRWHMLVILGYDAKLFRVYNPDPTLVNLYYDIYKSGLQGDLRSAKQKNDATDCSVIFPKGK
ncbi:MAG: C39 family peptidase [Candidatus Bathyarchaeia archaeon]